jgi:hypothetical protein
VATRDPAVVIPGHQRPEMKPEPASLAFMRGYLAFFDEALSSRDLLGRSRLSRDLLRGPGLAGHLGSRSGHSRHPALGRGAVRREQGAAEDRSGTKERSPWGYGAHGDRPPGSHREAAPSRTWICCCRAMRVRLVEGTFVA